MSNLTVKGNASGTGTVILEAPNTNSNRTITLPDATGTVNVSGLANEVPAGSAGAPAIYPTGDTNTGVFFPAAADTVAVATAGTERVRVTSAGDVGVGTASPAEKLSVAGAIRTHTASSAGFTLDAKGGLFDFVPGSVNVRLGYVPGTSGDNSGVLTFLTGSGTERARIDASGNLLVGTTSGINGHTFKSSEGVSTYRPTVSAGFGIHHFYSDFGSTQSLRAYFTANGGLSNFSANNVNLSDERVKTDIFPVGSYWDKVKALQVVTYKYRDQGGGEDNIGVIAQQVESVAPEFVCTSGFGETPADGVPLKSIYETDLHYATLKALQEAMARIEELTARIAILEAN